MDGKYKKKSVALSKTSAVNMSSFLSDSEDRHLEGIFYGGVTMIYDHDKYLHASLCFINMISQHWFDEILPWTIEYISVKHLFWAEINRPTTTVMIDTFPSIFLKTQIQKR